MKAQCIVCHERPAAFLCVQCHKPVCDECAFKDENGVFCSRECAARYRSYKQTQRPPVRRRPGGMLKGVIVGIVMAVLAALAAWKLGYLQITP